MQKIVVWASNNFFIEGFGNFMTGNELRDDGSFGQRNERDRGDVVLAVRTQWRFTLQAAS